MSVTVTEIYDGIRLHYQNGVGGVTRRFLIQGLVASNNPSDLFAGTISAQGIPQYRDPHPTINGLFASSFDGAPFIDQSGSTSKTAVLLEVGYSTPTFLPMGGVRIEVGGSNSQYILNRWPNGPQKGLPILVGYATYGGASFPQQIPPSYTTNNATNNSSGAQFDTAEIPIESPNAILRFTRTETAFPMTAFATYRRKISNAPWLGFDPFTVVCRNIEAVNMVGMGLIAQSYWQVTYEFEVAESPDYWVHVEFFKDIHTGKPIAGVNILDKTNNGYTLVVPYVDADFNGLKLPKLV